MADQWEDYQAPATNQWEDYNAPVPERGLISPNTGAYRSIEEGVQRGVAGTAALPRMFSDYVGAHVARGLQNLQNWGVGKLGLPESMKDTRTLAPSEFPTYEQARETIRQKFGGLPEYQPQNAMERGLTTAGEMLPNVVGPGGVAAGAARMLYPAAGASAAREAGLGPVGEAAGAFYGGMRAGRVGAGAGAAVPTTGELRDVAQTQGYRPIEQRALGETLAPSTVTPRPSGKGIQFNPSEASQTHKTIVDALDAQNFRADSTPRVLEALAPLETAKDMGNYLTARQKLAGIHGGKEGIAAQQARQMIETALEKRTPGMIEHLQTADQNWNRMRTAEMLGNAQKLVELKAEGTNSGMNVGAKLQQMATSILQSPKRMRYLSESDKQGLEDLSKNKWSRAAVKWAGNYLGGGGGLGALAASGAGYYLGGTEGGIAGYGGVKAIGAPLAGNLLRRGYNRSVQNQANRLQQQVLSQSPEAVARGATLPQPPSSALPYGILPAYLSQQ